MATRIGLNMRSSRAIRVSPVGDAPFGIVQRQLGPRGMPQLAGSDEAQRRELQGIARHEAAPGSLRSFALIAVRNFP